MQEPEWEKATEKEVWEYVAVHLKKDGIDTVLAAEGETLSAFDE